MKEKILKILDFMFTFSVITLSVLLFTNTISVNKLHGVSMEPTYKEGSYIIAIKPVFGYRPKRGQVIVTKKLDIGLYGENGDSISVIKRIIGMEGDIITEDNNDLYRNGELIYHNPTGNEGFRVTYTTEVPENSLYVVGDNYAESYDSRAFGCISEDDVRGIVLFDIGN